MIKILFSDLDRTLLTNKGTISQVNLNAMRQLTDRGIKLVIATGRNILSAKKIFSKKHNVDFLMFSSGAGVIDWLNSELIYENYLSEEETSRVIEILKKHEVDFMVHDLIPQNHKFLYWVYHSLPDFKRRIALYENYAEPLSLEQPPRKATQLLAILSFEEQEKFKRIKDQLDFVKVIFTTSPLDHKSIWLEVFPKKVSKGYTAQWLCTKLKIGIEQVACLGNDFNDLDMLNWSKNSYVVNNAPKDLKRKFNIVASNEENGFAEVVQRIL